MIVNFTNRNFGLDPMRTTAITLVLAIHLAFSFFTFDWWVLWYVAYLGVDIFFVLSGFLIGTLLLQAINPQTGRFQLSALRRFVLRRWLRTAPLYYILLAINFAAGYFLLHRVAVFDFRFLVWSQSLLRPPPAFFGEAWSLCIEEWFYILFPVGLFLCLKLVRSKTPTVILWYTVLFIAAGIVLRSVQTKGRFYEINIAFLRLDAIAYGVLFAVLDRFYLKDKFKIKLVFLAVAGFVLLVAGIVIFLKVPTKFSLMYYPLSGIGLGCLLMYCKQLPGAFQHSTVYRAVGFVSKISYSIYLNNIIVILLIKEYFSVQPIWQLMVAATIIVGIAILTFYYIELYFIKLRDKWIPAANLPKKESPVQLA